MEPRIGEGIEDIKGGVRKLSSFIFGIPDTDYIAEIRARISPESRNIRIDAETFNHLSAYIEHGAHAAEILITNTQDVTPEKLEKLPRSMQDTARLLLAGSKTLEAVKEKSKAHEKELKKIEKGARLERKKRIDDEIEDLATMRAEEIAQSLVVEKAEKLTERARKDLEVSERQRAVQLYRTWVVKDKDSFENRQEKIWRDEFADWKVDEWKVLNKDKKKFTAEEKKRIAEENAAIWNKHAKEWTEKAEADKKKEIAEGVKEYVAGDKRKRDETEDELKKEVKRLINRVDGCGRTIKKLRTRLGQCKCGAGSDSDSSDSDSSDSGGGGKKPNGSGKPPNTDGKRPGPGSGPGGNASGGKNGRDGTGGNPNKKSPPTGPKNIADTRDKNPKGTGSQPPPPNPHNQGTKPSSGGGKAPIPKNPNPLFNGQRRPPGGWPEERVERKPLSANPFEEAELAMLRQLRKDLLPDSVDNNKPAAMFGKTSGPPLPGQFGALSNPPTNTTGTGGNKPTPVFGQGIKTMTGGYVPPGAGGSTPVPGTGGNHVFGQNSRTMTGGYIPPGAGGNTSVPGIFGSGSKTLNSGYNPVADPSVLRFDPPASGDLPYTTFKWPGP